MVDIFFGHEGDLAASLGDDAHRPAWHTLDTFRPMAERVTAEFPNLKVLATTIRRPHTATPQQLERLCLRQPARLCFFQRHRWQTTPALAGLAFDDLDILDRVGGGDSFAAGLLYGLLTGKPLSWSLDCGIAHGALAMTTPGDASMVTLPEVERLMTGSLRRHPSLSASPQPSRTRADTNAIDCAIGAEPSILVYSYRS